MKTFNIILLVMISYIVSAQSLIDSLENELGKSLSDTMRVKTLNKLSDELNRNDPEKAMQYATQGLKISENLNYNSGMANSHKSIGTSHIYQSNFAEALKSFFYSLKIFHELADNIRIAVLYNDIGFVYFNQGKYHDALEYCQKSLNLLIESDNKLELAATYNTMGNIYFRQGKYSEALKIHFKSLEISEEQRDKQGMANSFRNIGVVLKYQGNFEKALEFYSKSLNLRIELEDKRGIAGSYINIGIIYENQTEYEKALEFSFKGLKILEELKDKMSVGSSYLNIGNIYFAQKNNESARNYYFKGLRIVEKLNNIQYLGTFYTNIAYTYLEEKNYQEAIVYSKKGMVISKEIASKEDVKNSFEFLAFTYAELKNYKEAYQYSKQYTIIKDSLFNEESTRQIAEMQTKYETEKKEQEIKLLNKDRSLKQAQIKRQKLFRNFAIAAAITFILLLIVLYNKFIFRKKINKLLSLRNAEILKQNNEIVNQKKSITDSILYAQQIQRAIFPPMQLMKENLNEHFIFFKPRDIVSGDFYWTKKINSKVYLVVADCTGHGVPGAFMSLLGISYLNEIMSSDSISNANIILNKLRNKVIQSLRQGGKNSSRDGMDISLCIFDFKNMKLDFAGANNHMYIIRNKEIIKLEADKMPIGIYINIENSFTQKSLEIKEGDKYYLFTDGYMDQFGGEKNNKFKRKKLLNLLLENHTKPMDEQCNKLEEVFAEWSKNAKQIDDILVVGISAK